VVRLKLKLPGLKAGVWSLVQGQWVRPFGCVPPVCGRGTSAGKTATEKLQILRGVGLEIDRLTYSSGYCSDCDGTGWKGLRMSIRVKTGH
jgi:hypothetical protein